MDRAPSSYLGVIDCSQIIVVIFDFFRFLYFMYAWCLQGSEEVTESLELLFEIGVLFFFFGFPGS